MAIKHFRFQESAERKTWPYVSFSHIDPNAILATSATSKKEYNPYIEGGVKIGQKIGMDADCFR